MNVREFFGNIDIYLFDQILKGRIVPGSRILDAGCGAGRNLVYFAREGFDIAAVDSSPDAVEHTRKLLSGIAPTLPAETAQVAAIDSLPFEDAVFDVVICSAVLHFSRDEEHFAAMTDELWRVLKPGGLFFSRLATTIGMESRVQNIEGRWYALPDGSRRFLCDEAFLMATAARLGGELADPLKTTIVQNMRSMTTWCLWKSV